MTPSWMEIVSQIKEIRRKFDEATLFVIDISDTMHTGADAMRALNETFRQELKRLYGA